MKQKLFVLSMDAMVGEDIEYLKTRPNFSRLMAHCARVAKAQTIYPSVTYPAHVSMITGCTANHHGIYNNTHFRTSKGYPAWHLYSDEIKVEDLFAAAKRAGCTTASVYWPVTGKNPNIDYLIDEFFFYEPEESASEAAILDCFRKLGASEDALLTVSDNMDRFPRSYKTKSDWLRLDQTFDHFINGVVCSMIRRFQPDVLVAHNCLLDSMRHKNGVFNDRVTWALDITDYWLGEIIQAMTDAGVLEDTNFVIVSDHGQMNFSRRVKPNVLFEKKGWIDVDADGKISDWKVYGQSNGMSFAVYVKDPALKQTVYDYLRILRDEQVWGFSEVYTREEVSQRYGWDGPFDFVLETDGYTTFSEDWLKEYIAGIDLSDYRLGRATHGYQPEKGPQPVFVATGPAFKKDVTIPFCLTLDESPTFAHILGQSMPQADGRVLTELLV
ncbi:MAG: alkaline phosphatase family protein [Spirochaetales bacterium]|nr:alkaline phosphatase family protein [Spirochaetales bacterium]